MARWKVYWGKVLLKINSKIKLLFMFVGTCDAIVKEGIDLALAANKPNYGNEWV